MLSRVLNVTRACAVNRRSVAPRMQGRYDPMVPVRFLAFVVWLGKCHARLFGAWNRRARCRYRRAAVFIVGIRTTAQGFVSIEVHGVTRTRLRPGAEVGRVAEHFRQRDHRLLDDERRLMDTGLDSLTLDDAAMHLSCVALQRSDMGVPRW